MIDLLHLPEPDERTVWFPAHQSNSSAPGSSFWSIWNKPRGISMVSIIVISGGGGGGGGASNSINATAGGGGGGSCGQLVSMTFLAITLPERLYVIAGKGGNGGGAGVSGFSGIDSFVCVHPYHDFSTSANALVRTNSGGSGGGAGTISFGGSVFGGGGNQVDGSIAPLGRMAVSQRFLNRAALSFNGSTGTASSQFIDNILMGGASGGGKTSGAGGAGGGYSAGGATLLNAVPGGTAETGEDASSGFIHAGIHYGGCGGGGNNLGVGGRGGNGVAWGAGGGGGGGGLTGGRGGDGGPGLVIIASW